MKSYLNVISFVVLGGLVGCSAPEEKPQASIETAKKTENKLEKVDMQPVKTYTGTVKYLTFEGGFYGIVDKNGTKFLPRNLDKQYRQEGAIIEFKGEFIKGMMTIQQWGEPFEIKEVKLIKAGNPHLNKDI